MKNNNANNNTNLFDVFSERIKQAQLKHLEDIHAQVEASKNPEIYETYEYHTADEGRIDMFAARKIGTKHLKENKPCQDYCMVTSVNGLKVLTDADGVSSCAYSDVGSRLACEAAVMTVEAASKSFDNEEQLVNRLMSLSFRERLVSNWISLVQEEIEKHEGVESAEFLTEFRKYGSTLMLAVITDNWIVAINIGDGQILVFNDLYGVKVRAHSPKESSVVRCLVNERCARENFIVAKYPRSVFSGVLLTTDGMYESFEKGGVLYEYAMQMKSRFLEREPHEPYQPFCYLEENQPLKDFSEVGTMDDCSIALAIDNSGIVDNTYLDINEIIVKSSDESLIHRWYKNTISYYCVQNGEEYEVLVSDSVPKLDELNLKSAVLDMPTKEWVENDKSYARYELGEIQSLEVLYSEGILRRQRYNVAESDEFLLKIHSSVMNLTHELNDKGYALAPCAISYIFYDGNDLHIRRETIIEKRTDEKKSYVMKEFDAIKNCFENVVGILESDKVKYPILDIGYIDKGYTYCFESEVKSEEKSDEKSEDKSEDKEVKLLKLVRKDKKLMFKNISRFVLELNDSEDHKIQPGEVFGTDKRVDFSVLGDDGTLIEEFRYMPKEVL